MNPTQIKKEVRVVLGKVTHLVNVCPCPGNEDSPDFYLPLDEARESLSRALKVLEDLGKEKVEEDLIEDEKATVERLTDELVKRYTVPYIERDTLLQIVRRYLFEDLYNTNTLESVYGLHEDDATNLLWVLDNLTEDDGAIYSFIDGETEDVENITGN